MKKLQQPISSNKPSGFSLLEMLAAMSLLMLIMGLLLTILTPFLKLWCQSEQQQEAAYEASTLLQFMTQDLESIRLLPTTLVMDIPLGNLVLPKNIFFLTTASSSALEECNLVGYFLTSSPRLPNTFCCYRFMATLEETRKAFIKGTLPQLAMTVSPADTLHCTLISSSIKEWKITPAWSSGGHFLLHPLSLRKRTLAPPDLIELSVTACSTGIQETSTLSTVVSLPSQ